MANSWQLESGQEYDPEKFYTKSKDKQGHSTTLRINLPDYLVANLAELVQRKAIPAYRTREDFVRDAIVHRYAWVIDQLEHHDLKSRFDKERRRLDAMEDAAARLAEVQENDQLLESLESVCAQYLEQHNWSELYAYLIIQREVVEELPIWYREKGQTLCERYWQKLPSTLTNNTAWREG